MSVRSILHLIPTLEGGGAERQLQLLAVEQARRGIETHVAIRRGGINLQATQIGGVNIHWLGDRRSIDPRLVLAIRRVVNDVRPTAIQTWLPQMDLLGGLIALGSRTPWIVSERTSGKYYRDIPNVARARLFIGRRADAIVANSDGGARYWYPSIQDRSKVSIVRNAIDVERILLKTAAPCEQPQRPAFLVVGRLHIDKAHTVVLDALAALPQNLDVRIIVVGAGPERDAIGRQIARLGLAARVTLIDYDPDWWCRLGAVDGLISMSRYEGNPNVVLEAMAAGCPLILSDIPGHREAANEACALFVPMDDPAALCAAICDAVASPSASRNRAEAAQRRIASMTVDAMANAYDLVYRNIIGARAG